MKDFVEHLRAKPESERRTIALSASIAVAGVVAVGWVIALFSSGALALAPVNTNGEAAAALEETRTRFSEMAGAASAFYPQAASAEVNVVEDDAPEAPKAEATEDTVLHF